MRESEYEDMAIKVGDMEINKVDDNGN